jgi:zinc transporter ZupT
MALHCFAGGMLLVSSYEISAQLAFHVFLGLVAHKAFEAITVSTVLLEKVKSKKELYLATGVYALSFPAGVLATIAMEVGFAGRISPENFETISMVITSVAVGSLLGCLLQDFLVPAFREVRRSAMVRFG